MSNSSKLHLFPPAPPSLALSLPLPPSTEDFPTLSPPAIVLVTVTVRPPEELVEVEVTPWPAFLEGTAMPVWWCGCAVALLVTVRGEPCDHD